MQSHSSPHRAGFRVSEVAGMFGISRKTLYEWIKRGWAPKPKKFGKLSIFFHSDIEDIEERARLRAEESEL